MLKWTMSWLQNWKLIVEQICVNLIKHGIGNKNKIGVFIGCLLQKQYIVIFQKQCIYNWYFMRWTWVNSSLWTISKQTNNQNWKRKIMNIMNLCLTFWNNQSRKFIVSNIGKLFKIYLAWASVKKKKQNWN
jgi:hypothetical protein